MEMNNIFNKIQSQINENNVVLYLKGSSRNPQCGFSATVVKLLNKLDTKFLEINVLEETEFRDAIKYFSNWPTIPQLYIKGKFVGGCDIVREMFKSGELKILLS